MFQLNCIDSAMLSGYSRRSACMSSVFFLEKDNSMDYVALMKKNITRNYRNTVIFDHILKEDLSKDKYPFLIKQKNPNIDEHFFCYETNNLDVDLKELIGSIINKEMDMSIPLWDIHYVESKEDQSQIAVIFRAHHSVVDGESRTNNFKYLFDNNIAKKSIVSLLRYIGPSTFNANLIHIYKYLFWKTYKIYTKIRIAFLKPVYRQEYNNLYNKKWDSKLNTTKNIDFFNIKYDTVMTVMKKYNVDFQTLFIYLFSTAYRNLMQDLMNFDSDKAVDVQGKDAIAGVPLSMKSKRDHLYGSQVYTMFCNIGLSVNDDMARLEAIKESLNSEKEFYNKSPVKLNLLAFTKSPYMKDLIKAWSYIQDSFWDGDKQQSIPLGTHRPFGIYINQTKTFNNEYILGNSKVDNFYSIPPLGKHDGTLGCGISVRSPRESDNDILIGFIFFRDMIPSGHMFKDYMHDVLRELTNKVINNV